MTPQLIEALGLFIVLPICGAAVFWKILDSYNQSATYEDPYRRIAIDAGRRVAAKWKSKERGEKCPDQ
jgi:hypothetical protein